MDRRTTYAKLSKIKDNENKILTIYELQKWIMINVASNEKTIKNCISIMRNSGLIKDVGDSRFQII